MPAEARAIPVPDVAALAAPWRALEAEAAPFSFFQSWSWVGCLAAERYDHPVLIEAREAGRITGLALFNRRRGRLHLTESGTAQHDAPFIEHNAPLLARDAAPETLATMLAAAWQAAPAGLVLSGVPPALADTAGGIASRRQQREAPWLDLARLRAAGSDALGGASANTRQQIRRALRRLAARNPLRLAAAAGTEEAIAWLDALIALHTARWQARGKPGAFAGDFQRRFHRALIAAALPRGECELLRVTTGERVLGYLYNFRLRGRVYAYQSGFDYDSFAAEKPGLACHALAIARALELGDEAYDFLAGAERYKVSLSNASTPMVWATLVPRLSLAGGIALLRNLLRRD